MKNYSAATAAARCGGDERMRGRGCGEVGGAAYVLCRVFAGDWGQCDWEQEVGGGDDRVCTTQGWGQQLEVRGLGRYWCADAAFVSLGKSFVMFAGKGSDIAGSYAGGLVRRRREWAGWVYDFTRKSKSWINGRGWMDG